MSFAADLQTLWHLITPRSRGGSHSERIETFYRGQAGGYDDFRRRLLHGRERLFQALPPAAGEVWVDLGAGTGANLECLGPAISQLRKVYLVDISPSLLHVARGRVADRAWTNVEIIEGDAATFRPEAPVDVVTCAYSLTMIPNWFEVVDQAQRMLRPGGLFGVVDFFVSRKYPSPGNTRHGWFTRHFWPCWFGYDDVFLNPDHLPYLHQRFEPVICEQRAGKIPYLPLLRAPYYCFVGRKSSTPNLE